MRGRTRVWTLVTLLALGTAATAWALRGTCALFGDPGGYIRVPGAGPDFFTDSCTAVQQEVCYDCTAEDTSGFGGWIHCAENEEGTDGSCEWYEEWDDVPDPPRYAGARWMPRRI